jgi:hypothetical protein
VVLRSGEVFVVGGFRRDGDTGPLVPALLFDPSTRKWRDAGSVGTTGHNFALTATLLSDGRVLVAGGFGGPSGPTSAAYLFDPALADGD